MTDIRMEWTDAGAVVSFTSDTLTNLNCPRCGAAVESGTEHRCGDKTPKPRKRVKAQGGAR